MTRETTPCVRLVTLALLVLAPSAAVAQSGIAGTVKDATGAVLPGVTVEAASPALIEKARTVVTDGEGLYKLVDLRPGVYVVTFTLAGFNTVKREGVELPASFTATVNVELRIGALEETVTVSGHTPTVDVENVTQQRVLQNDILNGIPSFARTPQSYSPYLPGVSGVNLGATGVDTRGLSIHGSRTLEANVAIDGFSTHLAEGFGGGADTFYANPAIVEELSVQTGGIGAEQQMSGIWTNVIPKEGSNRFSGFLFAGYSDQRFQANNLTPDEIVRGLSNSVGSLKNLWDVNPAIGGRILRDKLWFYGSYRNAGNTNYLPGLYYNKTPTDWVYTPDLSRPAITKVTDGSEDARFTWQVTPKNKVSVYYDRQPHVVFQRGYAATVSPEATAYTPYQPNAIVQAVWKSTVNNRLLLEAGMLGNDTDYNGRRQGELGGVFPEVSRDTVAAVESSRNFSFRASPVTGQNYGHHVNRQLTARAAASYVTGTHDVKVGFTFGRARVIKSLEPNGDMGVTLSRGVPIAMTLVASPLEWISDVDADLGIFSQDQWRLKRLTLNLGLRFDYFNSSVPAQQLPAGRFAVARDFAPVQDVPNWTDVSPRLGASYDLFGNGKTAVKVTLGRYLAGVATTIADTKNPVLTAVNMANRTWNDANGDFIPQCDFSNALANAECGPLSDLNFGKANPAATVYADDVLQGFGKRPFNWEGSVALQRELARGIAVNLAYFRRWYGNFTVIENIAVPSTGYSSYCVTAPLDPRLPGGGGNPICGFYDVDPAYFGRVQNRIAFASAFGRQEDVYDGLDLTTSARLPRGVLFSGGLSTGRERTNNCLGLGHPELAFSGSQIGAVTLVKIPFSPFCDIRPPFQTQLKFISVYPLPWWGLETNVVFQTIPGPQITASYVATSAQIRPSLGRNLASGVNGTATVDLFAPGTLYQDRVTQLDLRVTKVFKLETVRVLGSVDFYNLLNAAGIQGQNNRYGDAWQTPTILQGGRFLKFSTQISF